MSRRRLIALLPLLAIGAAAALVGRAITVETAVDRFVPQAEDAELADLAAALSDAPLTRSLVVAVRGAEGDREAGIRGSAALARALRALPGVDAQDAVDEGMGQALYDLYHPRRFGFLTPGGDGALEAALSDAGLRAALEDAKAGLAGSSGPALRRALPADPLGIFPKLVETFAARSGVVTVDGGRFFGRDGSSLIFVQTDASAFDATAQGPLIDAIDAFEAAANGAGVSAHEPAGAAPLPYGRPLQVSLSGVHPFAVHAQRAIRADIERVSVASTIAIALLFLVLLRPPWLFALGLLVVGAGFGVALTVTGLVFGELHILTLAFGAALIGVVVDYPSHLFNHAALTGGDHQPPGDAQGSASDPARAARAIWPGIAMGALTTILGLTAFAFTDFPGLQQVALFASSGVVGALLVTRWVIPALMPAFVLPSKTQRRLATTSMRIISALRSRRPLLVAAIVAALGLGVAGGAALRWEDAPSALSLQDPALVAEDAAVRELVGGGDAGRAVVSVGADDDDALTVALAVDEALRGAVAAGSLDRFMSPTAFIWPAPLQRRNDAALRDPAVAPRLRAAMEAAGFVPDAFAPFFDALDAPAAPPLTPADLEGSPVARITGPLRLTVPARDGRPTRVAWLTPVSGVRDAAELQARLDAIDGARLVDQGSYAAAVFGRFRTQSVTLMAIGLLLVLATLAARYRRVRPTLAAFTPAIVGGALTVGVLGLTGQTGTALHVMALLLVLSMGADYGVFLVESHGAHVPATMTSLVTACLTTTIGFGLLILSTNPALHAIGLTVGVGVIASFVAAPCALALLGPPAPPETS